MPIEERYLNEHVAKFLVFLDACYDGKLKAFSDEFSNFDNAFYEKLKKEVQRAKNWRSFIKKRRCF